MNASPPAAGPLPQSWARVMGWLAPPTPPALPLTTELPPAPPPRPPALPAAPPTAEPPLAETERPPVAELELAGVLLLQPTTVASAPRTNEFTLSFFTRDPF